LKTRTKILLALALSIAAIQLWPVDRSNPPVTSRLDAPPEVLAILRRSCFDCHSNETRWPWYAYVAPVSWLVAKDVEEGRRHMNFSAWGEIPVFKQEGLREQMVEEIEEGHMPLPIYLRMHGDARVSEAEIERLRKWNEAL
jgi:hypothetical protein